MNNFEQTRTPSTIELPDQVLISMDPVLVARAEAFIKKYPGDKEVAAAYKAYRDAVDDIDKRQGDESGKLISALDQMEKHYQFQAFINEFKQKSVPIIASLVKCVERTSYLWGEKMRLEKNSKNIPGKKQAIEEFNMLIKKEDSLYEKKMKDYENLERALSGKHEEIYRFTNYSDEDLGIMNNEFDSARFKIPTFESAMRLLGETTEEEPKPAPKKPSTKGTDKIS